MEREISESDLERNVSRVLGEVSQHHLPYVVLRDGRPAAAIVPYEQYRRFMATPEAAVLAQFERLQARMALTNARYADDEVEADVRQATAELRAQRRR